MNRLCTERRGQVTGCLVEGMSIRGVERITGVAKHTILKLLIELGQACSEYQDDEPRNLNAKIIETDEIWGFVGSKQKNVPTSQEDNPDHGDVWTWTAIDAETKLIPSWLVGERSVADCHTSLADLKARLRPCRIQLMTDGLAAYGTVADALWRNTADFAQLIKVYSKPTSENNEQSYSPAVCTGSEIKIRSGNPDPAHISTPYVERQNLTMRMGMRRFTRLSNGFSKKVENLAHSVSIHFMYYNFGRLHESLTLGEASKRTRRTPAMAAGLATHQWSLTQIAGLLD